MTTLKLISVLAALALVAGLWLRGEHYAARASTAAALARSALGAANANAEIARLQSSASRRIDGVSRVNEINKRALRAALDRRQKEIRHAPPETDGPLAPVLRDQLDRLPERAGADPGADAAAPGHTCGAASAD